MWRGKKEQEASTSAPILCVAFLSLRKKNMLVLAVKQPLFGPSVEV